MNYELYRGGEVNMEIKKRIEEMAEKSSDGGKAVGLFLCELIEKEHGAAADIEKALAGGKTLDGGYKEISDYAKKVSPNAPTVVLPEKAAELVRGYMEIREHREEKRSIFDML